MQEFHCYTCKEKNEYNEFGHMVQLTVPGNNWYDENTIFLKKKGNCKNGGKNLLTKARTISLDIAPEKHW